MIRSAITFTLFLTASGLAFAADLAGQVQRCQKIDNDIARLACFDAVAGGGENLTAQEEVADRQSTPAAPVARPTPPSEADVPRRSEVVEIKKTIDNRHIFYLRDGSVWIQARSSHRRYKEGVKVVVRRVGPRGAFSSYRMEMGDQSFRVIQPD
jgi:hypothetical protein